MKDKTMYLLSLMVGIAIITAIVGDYVVAALETTKTGEPQEVSSDVMTLVQTALVALLVFLADILALRELKKTKINGSHT